MTTTLAHTTKPSRPGKSTASPAELDDGDVVWAVACRYSEVSLLISLYVVVVHSRFAGAGNGERREIISIDFL